MDESGAIALWNVFQRKGLFNVDNVRGLSHRLLTANLILNAAGQ